MKIHGVDHKTNALKLFCAPNINSVKQSHTHSIEFKSGDLDCHTHLSEIYSYQVIID